MVAYYTQFVGETRDYQQPISGDTIVSVVWSCDPGGTVVTTDPGTGRTATTGRLTTFKAGRMTLKVLITCESGQVVAGEARIIVST